MWIVFCGTSFNLLAVGLQLPSKTCLQCSDRTDLNTTLTEDAIAIADTRTHSCTLGNGNVHRTHICASLAFVARFGVGTHMEDRGAACPTHDESSGTKVLAERALVV
jgi:hypothetical protein